MQQHGDIELKIDDAGEQIFVTVHNERAGVGSISIVGKERKLFGRWVAMGNLSVEEFFVSTESDYLMERMASGVSDTIDAEPDEIRVVVRHRISELFDMGCLTEWEVDWCLENIEQLEISDERITPVTWELMTKLYGGDWMLYLPQIKNPMYFYIEHMIVVVKNSLKKYVVAGLEKHIQANAQAA